MRVLHPGVTPKSDALVTHGGRGTGLFPAGLAAKQPTPDAAAAVTI